jgi:hypothetical protein
VEKMPSAAMTASEINGRLLQEMIAVVRCARSAITPLPTRRRASGHRMRRSL